MLSHGIPVNPSSNFANYMNGDFTTPLKPILKSHEHKNEVLQDDVSAQEPRQIYHLLKIQDDEKEYSVLLEGTNYTIGRNRDNSISLNSSCISRYHASLARLLDPITNQYFFRIFDGDAKGKPSLNGLVINDVRCFTHDLKHGDIIKCGDKVTIIYKLLVDFEEN